MLTEPLIQQLTELRLRGMATALEQQLVAPDMARQTFEHRLGLMLPRHSRSSWRTLRARAVNYADYI